MSARHKFDRASSVTSCAVFLACIQQLDSSTPVELDLHLILDNSAPHKTEAVRAWLESIPFQAAPPTSASWLNAVDGWFAQLEPWALYRDTFSVADLRAAIRCFIAVHNELQPSSSLEQSR